MCGIFAYSGSRKNAAEIVIQGLKKLEYRGYDSWGVAYNQPEQLGLMKKVGKIGEFNLEHSSLPQSTLAIGHSRWATHGGVTVENAHPHLDEKNQFAVVHNGIIENWKELREELTAKGYHFTSETDTEAIVHLLAEYAKENNFVSAAKLTLKRLKGRYAVLLIHAGEQKIIAARRGSPLIVGVGDMNGKQRAHGASAEERALPEPELSKQEFFIASDVPAFLEHTRKVMYLDDNEMVIINEQAHFFNLDTGEAIEKRVVEIEWKEESAKKGAFKHFMIKEIMEQKDTLYRAINQSEAEIMHLAEEIKKAYGTFLIGCGTAGKVCHAASYVFASVAKRHINVVVGSEFPSQQQFLKEKSLVIAISQSGETADNLEAIEVAKKKGAKVLSIVNVEGSTMDRLSDYTLHLKAGPEIAVASTKATTAQLAILTLLAYACDDRLAEGKRLLIETAGKLSDMLNPRYEEHIQKLAEKIKDSDNMYVIGKAVNFPIALEAAIKLQEVSYIHAEGFAGGELKHGPLALISQGTPCIVLVSNDETRTDILNNAQEVRARGGFIIGVSPQNEDVFDYWIKVPEVGEASGIVNIIPIQLLAYHLAVLRQNNPDMPRNLAKSVTVK